MPAAPTTVVAIDLSNATRHAEPTEPTNGTPVSSNTSRSAPSSPASPCSKGKTTEPVSSASRESNVESTSDSTTSIPRERSAWLTRRPERNDTSRSCDRPPESTITACRFPLSGTPSFFHDHQIMINFDQDQLLARVHDHQG